MVSHTFSPTKDQGMPKSYSLSITYHFGSLNSMIISAVSRDIQLAAISSVFFRNEIHIDSITVYEDFIPIYGITILEELEKQTKSRNIKKINGEFLPGHKCRDTIIKLLEQQGYNIKPVAVKQLIDKYKIGVEKLLP